MIIRHPYRDPVVARPPTQAERRENRHFALFLFAILLIWPMVMVSHAGCGFMANEDQAVRAATNLGFTEVRVESRAVMFLGWRGCSKSDDAGFTVTGKNPQGQRVTLLVCVGWPFKGATVRTK